MADSFKARVDKVFGSLPNPQPLNDNNNRAIWSLTDDEVHKREWNRHRSPPPQDDDLCGPFAPRPDASLSNRRTKLLSPAGSWGKIKPCLNDQDEEDDLDDDEEEEEDEAGPSDRMFSRPEDHDDDDEWIILLSVGMDCTLDKEDEEDEFDKLAVGREKKTGDRMYMNEIIDYTTHADTFYELPTSVEDVGRDPRANRLAAELRLKEDAEAISELKGNQNVVVCSKNSQNGLPVNPMNVRPILKKDEKKAEPKSLKRVRFDPEIGCHLKKQATGSDEEIRDSLRQPQSDSRVPDYLHNPSKYTQYTFDSTNALDEEKATKKAFMDLYNLVRQNRADESQSSACNAGESPNTVTFVPRKKSNDSSIEQGDASNRSSHKETIASKSASPVIAAADDACVMDEDEKPETTPVCNTIPRKAQRRYRARAAVEPLDE